MDGNSPHIRGRGLFLISTLHLPHYSLSPSFHVLSPAATEKSVPILHAPPIRELQSGVTSMQLAWLVVSRQTDMLPSPRV